MKNPEPARCGCGGCENILYDPAHVIIARPSHHGGPIKGPSRDSPVFGGQLLYGAVKEHASFEEIQNPVLVISKSPRMRRGDDTSSSLLRSQRTFSFRICAATGSRPWRWVHRAPSSGSNRKARQALTFCRVPPKCMRPLCAIPANVEFRHQYLVGAG